MCYLIAMIFYTNFYLFALIFNYFDFQIFDFVLFFIFLLLYRFFIQAVRKHYFIVDGIAALLITLFIYAAKVDYSLCFYIYLMYFCTLESFTYTYLDISKYDNSLTKS